MKKLLLIIFALTLFLFAMSFEKTQVSANAETKGELISSETEYSNDGSYLLIEYYTKSTNTNARGNLRVVTHTKVVTQYSKNNKVLWVYTLIGDWHVIDGVSVQASASVVQASVHDNSWSFALGDQTYYDATVHGGGVFTHKLLGITTKTIIMDINMTCDIYGNLVEY